MKRMIILTLIFLVNCSGTTDWDSGAERRQDLQQQRMEDISESVNNQFPTATPGTERNQPF